MMAKSKAFDVSSLNGGGAGKQNKDDDLVSRACAPDQDDWWNIKDGYSLDETFALENDDAPFSELSDWCGNYYYDIREASAGNSKDAENMRRASKLESYIAENPGFSGTLYRGIGVDRKTLDNLKVGATIDQKGISSWSRHLDTADNFAYSGTGNATNPVIFRMRGSSQARDISSYNKHEAEVLLSSKSEQVITRVTRKNGIMYIDVEEV